MRSLRPILLALPLALLLAAGTARAGIFCDVGVPGCCATDPDCEDFDLCDGVETCEIATGTCQAGTPVLCDDAEACTTDSCDPSTGLCDFTPVADATPCDDADACTQTDTCQSGACVGTDPVLCDDAEACTTDACDPSTGLCDFTPVPDATPCDDADACTQTDTCQSGACVGADPLFCDDLDDCTDDACDPGLGVCTTSPAADGTPCNDQNGCTQTDACQGGVCVGADPVQCDDGNACTMDACVPALGTCSFVDEEDGFPCDDGDACSQLDVCATGACTGTQPVDCDDQNACTADVCTPATGACSNPPIADGAPCDDGDGCTQTDGCVSGTCVGTNPLPCDDGLTCTVDACDDGTCTFTPDDAQCADGECFDGHCDPTAPSADAFGCVPVPARGGEPCTDDGASCTDDMCATGLCVHVPVHAACAIDDPCAMGICDPANGSADAAGCVASPALPNGAACTEDLDPCTRDRCAAAMCTHDDVPNREACEPVLDPFRQALVLAAFARELRTQLALLSGVLDSRRIALLNQVDRVIEGLDAGAAELNGADPEADTAKARAKLAFRPLKRLPKEAKRLVKLLRLTSKRDPVDPLEVERLRRSADDLRTGVRELKRDVRRLRRALRSFVQ